MSDRIRPEDHPAWREEINREAAQRGEPPHVIINDKAFEEGADEWMQAMEEFEQGARRLYDKAPPSEKDLMLEIIDNHRPLFHYKLDLVTRQRAATMEKAYLREELKELGPHRDKYAEAATQLSAKHLEEDQKLAASHDKDLQMLHSKELMAGDRDRIRDVQAQELDNLKGRQEVEALKLAKALSRERGLREGRDQEQARDQTGRPQSDELDRRAWERIREARQRHEDQKKRGKDRDDGRERDG